MTSPFVDWVKLCTTIILSPATLRWTCTDRMAHVLRPLMQWPRWRHRPPPLYHFLNFNPTSPRISTNLPFIAFLANFERGVHFRARALKLRDASSSSDADESDDESSSNDSGMKKSRNERKREARRAVRWGMELANFSPPQIKRILRVAALEQDVLDALMLVKRLGRDVREGKRRQFNYIGRLLREVEPELMDGLIQATKDGDMSKFQDFSVPETSDIDDEEEEEKEMEDGVEEEDSINIALATRWYDGLLNKDISITNEIYSLQEVEFDRQELRQLVRKAHSTLDDEADSDEKEKAAAKARKSLSRFLQDLAKQLPADEYSVT